MKHSSYKLAFFLLSIPLIGATAAAQDVPLIGLTTGNLSQYSFLTVNAADGSSAPLGSEVFTSSYFGPSFAADPNKGVIVVQTFEMRTPGSLLTFDLATGASLNSTVVDGSYSIAGFTSVGLVGVGGINEIRGIDPQTGTSTLLNTFSSFYSPRVTTSPYSDKIVVTTSGTETRLLTYSASTGELLSDILPSVPPIGVVIAPSGLLGITGLGDSSYELRLYDPATGVSQMLSTFSSFYVPGIVGDLASQTATVLTSDFGNPGDMITFDMQTGAQLYYVPEGNVFTGLAAVPEPSTYALLFMTGAGALWMARRRR